MIKVIYMGKDKNSSIEGLKYLIKKGIQVLAVVSQSGEGKGKLLEFAKKKNFSTVSYKEIISSLSTKDKLTSRFSDVDLVISFLFWEKIEKKLIDLPKIGCVNFHPAPLPDFRGLGGYNIAIYENLNQWGVSAHFVDETFDSGDIIKVRRFNINPKEETAFSLEQKSQDHLLKLFKEIIDLACTNAALPRTPQSKGRYINRKEFEELKKIKPSDTIEQIKRKIRAFWYPPYMGATVKLKGEEFTLVSNELLERLSEEYAY